MENDKAADKPDHDSFWGWRVGLSITVGYIVLAGIVLLSGHFAAPATMSDLANTITGVFAPLAVLWLYIATMIQSDELALQRRELRDTRHEFELTRGVGAAHSEHTRKLAEVMERMQIREDQRQADEALRVEEQALVQWVVGTLNYPMEGWGSRPVEKVGPLSAGVSSDADIGLHTICENLAKIAAYLGKYGASDHYIRQDHSSELVSRLKKLQEFVTEVSPKRSAFLKAQDLDTAVKNADLLLSKAGPVRLDPKDPFSIAPVG